MRAHPNRRFLLLATALSTAFGSTMVPAIAQAQPNELSSNLSSNLSPQGKRTPPTEGVAEKAPEGVSIEKWEWLNSHRVALFIRSEAMPEELVQVQVLLARDWYSHPDQTYPELWALDGLRARNDHNGWTLETNIEKFAADKNVNVILPVGGESSFYSDWQSPDNGKHYMWESFLTKELVPLLKDELRSNGKRAVVGISMGGTAAVNLAERHPDLFSFVGSFSGYLDTTTAGMPEAIGAATRDAGGYNAEAMWGPYGSQDWIDHDPKLGLEYLKGKTVYVSAGSGHSDYNEPNSVAKAPALPAGIGLEILSRLTTQTFVKHAKDAGLNVITKFRPSGVHSWEYWQFEMLQAWPYIANALAIPEGDREALCNPVGAIGEATKDGALGSCINDEYDVPGGKAEDFRNGTAYWSPDTGAQLLIGAINGRYNALGGPASWLGFPTTGELTTPDGVGRYVHFQNGSIYWTPELGAVEVPRDMFDLWGTRDYERGDLGYPMAAPQQVDKGWVQQFQGGYIVRTPENKNFWLRGAIAAKYAEMKFADSELGWPKSNENLIKGGAFQEFTNGNIYWSPDTGAKFIRYGAIFDAWGKKAYEQGVYGYPRADFAPIPAGGEIMEFQNGTIRQVNGRIEESR